MSQAGDAAVPSSEPARCCAGMPLEPHQIADIMEFPMNRGIFMDIVGKSPFPSHTLHFGSPSLFGDRDDAA